MKRLLVRAALAVVAAVAVAAPSQAAFSVTLSNGVDPSVTITDGGAGDLNPLAGFILIGPTNFGGYSLSGGISSSFVSGTNAELQQSELSVTNVNGANPITITAFNTANTNPTGPVGVETRLTVLNFQGDGTVSSNTGIDAAALAPVSTTNAAGLFINTTNAVAPGSYTFSNRVTLSLAQGANVDVQARSILAPVPAPSALLLAGLGVPALGLIRRWTRRPAIA
jgi:hypothetical protein